MKKIFSVLVISLLFAASAYGGNTCAQLAKTFSDYSTAYHRKTMPKTWGSDLATFLRDNKVEILACSPKKSPASGKPFRPDSPFSPQHVVLGITNTTTLASTWLKNHGFDWLDVAKGNVYKDTKISPSDKKKFGVYLYLLSENMPYLRVYLSAAN